MSKPTRRRAARAPSPPAPAVADEPAPTAIAFHPVTDIAAVAPDADRDFVEDPSILPNMYILNVRGGCLEPAIPDGAQVLIDKNAPFRPGELVVVYRRREATPPGECQVLLKYLAMGVPPWVKFPFREHPKSDVHATLMLSQLNPKGAFAVPCGDVLAVYRCMGLAPPAAPATRASTRRARARQEA